MSFDISNYLPLAPLHWTSIFHYILILGTLAALFMSEADSSNLFIVILMALAVGVMASLYIDKLGMPRLVIFLIRAGLAAMTMMIAGLGPNQFTRQVGLISSFFSIPLLTATFLGCMVSILLDPRLAHWCF